jgi:hypothetical protein
MYISAKHLNGFTLHNNGDSLGKLTDLFFDAKSWKIRYMVVDTGTWLVGRRVLLSTDALEKIDSDARVFHVNVTMEQVENSPGVDLLRPVTRSEMEEIHKHYGWPAFQVFPTLSPMVPLGFLTPPSAYISSNEESACAELTPEERKTGEAAQYCFTPEASANAGEGDVHLRSTNEVDGYHIQAMDGALGHVQDFLVDETEFGIRYVVVDTKNWIPGRVVLLPTAFVAGVDWQASLVRVNLTREQVQTSPEYDHSAPVDSGYEDKLMEHYEQTKAKV